MHGKGAGAVNRVELECQVLCAALRQSWVRKDKVGAFTSIRELSHLFPDLLPPPEERDGSNKANYYSLIAVRPGAGLNGIVVGYLRTVRKFLKENNPKDQRQLYNSVLNAGFVLRKPRLRLSHDLVVARRWLYESQMDDDEAEEQKEEEEVAAVTSPAQEAPPPPVSEPVRPAAPPEPAAPKEPTPIPVQEPAPYLPPVQAVPVAAQEPATYAPAAELPPMPPAEPARPVPVEEPPAHLPVAPAAIQEAAVASEANFAAVSGAQATPMLGSTYDPLAAIENTFSSASKQPSAFVTPESPVSSAVLDNSGAPPVVPVLGSTASAGQTADPTTAPTNEQETVEVSRPPEPAAKAEATPRPLEEPKKAAAKSREFVFDETQLRKPEADIELPSVIRLMETAHLITKVEVQALKAQMQLAPNIHAEQLCINAGYLTKNEIASLRLAQDLLSSGKITMAQFQVAMYDERTSGLRMAESLQVRGWLETEVKNPMET